VSDQDDPGFSFQDKRRIDPETGEVREPGVTPAAPAPPPGDGFDEIVSGLEAEADLGTVDSKVAELTTDLQRVHAEYANYRKRVDRDRDTHRDLAVGSALSELLPVLDDIGRARIHGDLEGAFKSGSASSASPRPVIPSTPPSTKPSPTPSPTRSPARPASRCSNPATATRPKSSAPP
jgi:hypothetical protein